MTCVSLRQHSRWLYWVQTACLQVDEEVAHGLAGIRRLVQTLQDQVDSSTTAPAADDSNLLPSSRKVSSSAQAFVLESVRRVSREIVAAKAAWALANLAANNKENQDAIRSALLHVDNVIMRSCDHAAVLACRISILPCMLHMHSWSQTTHSNCACVVFRLIAMFIACCRAW